MKQPVRTTRVNNPPRENSYQPSQKAFLNIPVCVSRTRCQRPLTEAGETEARVGVRDAGSVGRLGKRRQIERRPALVRAAPDIDEPLSHHADVKGRGDELTAGGATDGAAMDVAAIAAATATAGGGGGGGCDGGAAGGAGGGPKIVGRTCDV